MEEIESLGGGERMRKEEGRRRRDEEDEVGGGGLKGNIRHKENWKVKEKRRRKGEK